MVSSKLLVFSIVLVFELPTSVLMFVLSAPIFLMIIISTINKGSHIKFPTQVTTRNDRGIRGVLYATVVAFDKQWNLALSDVLEVWKRKGVKKRKIPPGMGKFYLRLS